MKFYIRYGLGGGFGGMGDWEEVECDTLEEAENEAYEAAKEEYMSYEGMHGLVDVHELMEEGMSEDAAFAMQEEDIEQWCEYEAVAERPKEMDDG